MTQPLIEGLETAEDLIVYCARVSNPSNQMNTETGARLLNYCIRNKHWSVFETVTMTVEIKTTRAIAAQILRHRSFSFQEFSQRYATASTILPTELRAKNKSNRQSSTEVINPIVRIEDGKFMVQDTADNLINKAKEQLMKLYTGLIESGVAPECARDILPLSTETTLYMTGSVRSWIHYLSVRDDEHTQLEHQRIAVEVKNIFKSTFPITSTALGYAG